PGSVLAGVGLVAVATAAGAWLARHCPGNREIWFGAAAGALLIIAGVHLLPDAWSGARAARISPGLVPGAAGGAFPAAGLRARGGGQEPKERARGSGGAAALVAHRFLAGSAIALAGSITVAVALAVHAFGEGLATGALLGSQPRRTVSWLAAMSISPLVGAA